MSGELPLRVRVRERRQQEEKEKQKLDALSTNEEIMWALLSPHVSDVLVRTWLDDPQRKLPVIIWSIRKALHPGLEGWVGPISASPEGNMLLWSRNNFGLEAPGNCLTLPGWRGSLKVLLKADSGWKRKTTRRSADSDFFLADSGSLSGSLLSKPFKRWRAILSAGVAKRPTGVIRRLTVEAMIVVGKERADYRCQLNDFGEISIYCIDIQHRLNIMPSFLLSRLRERTFKIYQTMIGPHLTKERSAMLTQLGKHATPFICRDLHSILLDLLLPTSTLFFPATTGPAIDIQTNELLNLYD